MSPWQELEASISDEEHEQAQEQEKEEEKEVEVEGEGECTSPLWSLETPSIDSFKNA